MEKQNEKKYRKGGVQGMILKDETRVPHLQEILELASIQVKRENRLERPQSVKRPLTYQEGECLMNLPDFCLHCKNVQGERVVLTFTRNGGKSNYLIVVIRPQPQSFFKTFIQRKRNMLVDEVMEVLKAHGAQDFDVLDAEENKG
jgi:hypothetical protein